MLWNNILLSADYLVEECTMDEFLNALALQKSSNDQTQQNENTIKIKNEAELVDDLE